MSIIKPLDKIGDVRRFSKITSILFEEGFAYLFEKAKITWVVPFECRIRCFLKMCVGMWSGAPPKNLPERLREVLIRLGPTFIKLGQVLSLRPDIVSPEIAKELEKLTSDVPPVSFPEIKNIIESELGRHMDEIFKSFDEAPIGSASLAQVHSAVLADGTKVAVKVQRPKIKDIIQKDINIMFYAATLIEEKIPELSVFEPVAVVKEFSETIARELDFTIEAIHAKRFAAMFENDKSVKIAKIFDNLSTKRVLTMELIEGIHVDDDAGLKKAKINKEILAENGVNAFLRQVFVEGFFHADPHPGNYFALPGNVFAFIDYGMVGRMIPKMRLEFASFFISFLNEDSQSAIDHIMHIVRVEETSNVSSFQHDVDDVLHQWFGAKLREVNLSHTFFRIIDSGRKNKIFFPSSFAYLAKALYTTEAMGIKLDPGFDFAVKMRPFITKIIKAELSPSKVKKLAEDKALDYISYAQSLPETAASILEKLEKGEITFKVSPEELKDLQISLGGQNIKRLGIIIFAAVAVSVSVMYALQKNLLNIHFNVTLFGGIFITVVIFILFFRKNV